MGTVTVSAMESGDSTTVYPYPKSIPFILTTEFCERFSYYGMRAILTLFVNQVIGWSETDSSVLFHGFTVVAYLTPILGAILADSFIGKFRTIFYVSLIYGVGQLIITLGSVGDTTNGNKGIENLPSTALVLVGLLLVGLGTGGIKPCVATFGGDQFKLPEQKKQSVLFFSIFYWAVNLGSLCSMLLTPQLRARVSCLGQDYCYPLAFAVPAGLMFIAIGAFLIGRLCNMYKINLPDRNEENVIKKTLRCMWFSIRSPKIPGETHWLDRGESKFGAKFVADVKAVYNVAFMMLPFPIFWALFDQQGSRWTFQASRMNGDFFGVFTLQPDNIQVANAIMILILVPIFDIAVYPLLAKLNLLKTSLQRIGVGFFLAALAFIVSGIVDLQLEKTYPDLPGSGNGQIIAYDMTTSSPNCQLSFNLGEINFAISPENPFSEPKNLPTALYNLNMKQCCGIKCDDIENFKVTIAEEESTSLYFWKDPLNETLLVKQAKYENRIEKSSSGRPFVKILWAGVDNLPGHKSENNTIILKRTKNEDKKEEIEMDNDLFGDSEPAEVGNPTEYKIFLNEAELGSAEFKQGGNYNILVSGVKGAGNIITVDKVTPENTFSMFWQLPQYLIMTGGEVLFSITTMEFCFTQAPVTMKAVMLGMRYLTNAFGNVIDIVVMKAFEGVLPKQAYEFFLFGGLTLICMVIFGLMARGYKYVDYTNADNEEEVPTKESIEEKEQS